MHRAAPRGITIDALRAAALLGVVVVNIAGYTTFPDSGHIVPPPVPADAPLAALTQWLVMALLQGKAYPLLAFLFGVGFAASLRARGSGGIVHRRTRMRRLLVLGLAHGVLLYAGDVLAMYALCGLLLLRWATLRTGQLVRRLRWMLALALVCIVVQAVVFVGLAGIDTPPPQTLARVDGWPQFVWLNGTRYIAMMIAWPMILPQILVAMLAGTIAGRLGLLTRRRWRAAAARCAARALPLGLVLNGALAAWVLQPGATLQTAPHPAAPLFGVVGPVLSIGFAATVVARPALLAAIAPAGRLTLSMYLGASLLMALTLSGAGLGWQPGSVATLGLGLAGYALLLAAAWTAASRGSRGVFERWLAR